MSVTCDSDILYKTFVVVQMKNSDRVRGFADAIDKLESSCDSDAAKSFANDYGTDMVNALIVVSNKYIEIMSRSLAKKEEEKTVETDVEE